MYYDSTHKDIEKFISELRNINLAYRIDYFINASSNQVNIYYRSIQLNYGGSYNCEFYYFNSKHYAETMKRVQNNINRNYKEYRKKRMKWGL